MMGTKPTLVFSLTWPPPSMRMPASLIFARSTRGRFQLIAVFDAVLIAQPVGVESIIRRQRDIGRKGDAVEVDGVGELSGTVDRQRRVQHPQSMTLAEVEAGPQAEKEGPRGFQVIRQRENRVPAGVPGIWRSQ